MSDPLNPMGLAEIVALLLALFVPTTLFIGGYYIFTRTLDPFRRKERKGAQAVDLDVDLNSAAQVANLEKQIVKLYRKGDKFSAFELYKQAHNVSFGDAEVAVEQLIQSRS